MEMHRPNVSIEDALKEPEKYIPEGIYCHYGDYLCPFWDLDDNHDGYCHYLKRSDHDCDYISLLWDMCKECYVNYDDEEGF